MRVYFTLGRSPVEANSVVVTICYYQMLSGCVYRFAAPSVSGLFTLGWMCPLKREQARRERESELRLVNSL